MERRTRRRLRVFAANMIAVVLPLAALMVFIILAVIWLPSWFTYVLLGASIILILIAEWRRAGREIDE